ncbi:outer membrane beta-barrel protein [Algoriphagus boritolerans]|nr:hypothetical protein [Algoriphagus boritolerans]
MKKLFFFAHQLILIVLLGLSIMSFAQAQEKKSDMLGVLFTGESTLNRLSPNIGVVYERNFSRKIGVETGLFYRTFQEEFFVTISNDFVNVSDDVRFVQGFVAIPVLFRFDARFVQISLGPQVDIFAKWHQIRKSEINLTDYSRSPRIQVGPLLKIGKEISFKETLILEPELRYGIRSIVWEPKEDYFGIGLKLKKGLSKD